MTQRRTLDTIARTVLYEGYALYPYRPSSLKNSKPCAFGILYPQAWADMQTGSDRSQFRAEILLRGPESSQVSILIRFLQFAASSETKRAGNQQPWALEREVSFEAIVADISAEPHRQAFSFGDDVVVEGEIALDAKSVGSGIYKLVLQVRNTSPLSTPDHHIALMRSLASAHAVIESGYGGLVSVTDPAPELAEAAATCRNEGVWPVLLGVPGETTAVLASPIILPDYPQVAPESPGDLFDATEIDEILTLRILTLTEGEKAEMRMSDQRTRTILERAEALSADHLMNLHGTIRGMTPAGPELWSAWDNSSSFSPLTSVCDGSVRFSVGDRVRLHPRKRADIFDSALTGRVAVIAGIEEDFDQNVHIAVVVEDDPGRDLGEMRYIGHRFFFSLSEIEPLRPRVAEGVEG